MPVPETLIEAETELSYRKLQRHLQRLKRQGISFNFQRSTATSFGILFYGLNSLSELNLVCANLSEIMLKPTTVIFSDGENTTSLSFQPAPVGLKRSDPRLAKPISSLAIPAALATYLATVHNLHYVGDLASRSYADIKGLRGISNTRADRVEQALRAIGLQTGMNIPDWPPPKLDS